MSIAISNLVWQYFHSEMGHKLLAVKLADNADEFGRSIYPSVQTCALFVGASTRSIQRWLKELVAGGLIEPVKYVTGGRGKACEYRFNPEFIAAHDPRVPHDQRPKWEFKFVKDKAKKSKLIDSQKGDTVSPFFESQKSTENTQKGDTVSPFSKSKRVTGEAQKGDTAVSQKGDTAVSPQLPLTVIEPNTPLPPSGGDAEKNDLNDLLARLIEAHGRHSTSDTMAAQSALRKLAPAPASSERLLADLRAEVRSNDQWRRDDGRFRPRLSKWLRGWRAAQLAGLRGAAVREASIEAPGVVEAQKVIKAIDQARARSVPPPPEAVALLRRLKRKGLADAGGGGAGSEGGV